MTALRIRLLAAFALFAIWIGWLAYQALTYDRSPVVSRSQLLISKIDVIGIVKAEVDGRPATMVNVQELHWPADGAGLKPGDLIQVTNLPESSGFTEPGLYILPLVPDAKPGEFRVAGLPPSPGFDRFGHSPHFIYRLTPLARQQLDAIPKQH